MSRASGAAGDWLALYGSLMRGLGGLEAAGIAAQVRYVGPCAIPGELFDLGDYPGLRPGDGRVVGELYSVLAPEAFARLDAFEGYEPDRPRESLYLRERIELLVPRGQHAWLYVYNHVPDAHARVPDGDWRAHLAARAHARGQSDVGAPGGDRA